MKKVISIISILVVSLFFAISVNAQVMGPSNPPGGPQPGDQPIGGGAPIGGGLFILLGMGAAYGGRKLYKLHKDDDDNKVVS